MHTHAIDAFGSPPLGRALGREGQRQDPAHGDARTAVQRPMLTVNVTAAALFRKLDEGPTTVLLDEADTYLGVKVAKDHEELRRGLVNAGHRRGAVASAAPSPCKGCRGPGVPSLAPVALAGIGDLPDTIFDRSVVVAMKRRAPNETVEGFRQQGVDQTEPLRERMLRWANATSTSSATSSPICLRASSTDPPTCGNPW